jgi:hypothetical protein
MGDDSWDSKVKIGKGKFTELGETKVEEVYREFVPEDMERDLDSMLTLDDVQNLYEVMGTGFDKAEEVLKERHPEIKYESHRVLMYVSRKAIKDD